MRWRRLVCWGLVLAALGLVWAVALADTVRTKDGRTYTGAVDVVGDKVRIVVTKEDGTKDTVVLSKNEVEEIVRTPTALQQYAEREAQIRPDDGEGRLTLALWCERNNLKTEAVRECARALVVRPDHPEARELMLRLLRLPGTVTIARPPDQPATQPTKIGKKDLLLEERPATQNYFRVRVQPVLDTTCAGAQCHGGPRGGRLRLKRSRIGALPTRDVYLPNFDAVYPYVTDFYKPEKCLLLQHPLAVKEGGIPSRCQKVFRSQRDAKYRTMARLIEMLLLPAPPKSGQTERQAE